MLLRPAAAACAILMLSACAPAPTMSSPPAPEESPTASAIPSQEPTSAPTTAPAPSPSPTPEESPSAEESETAAPEPDGEGWFAVDATLADEASVEAQGFAPGVADYFRFRIAEGCEATFTVFAAHPDGFVVGEEAGVCEGSGLFVYGPDAGGAIDTLVEFGTVQPCSAFRDAGVPAGVPKTTRFPDGLVCDDGGLTNY